VNRKPTILRRSLAVAGAAFVGLAATVALGSPASAHHPVVTGDYECVDGGWEVTWTVTNSENDLDGKLIDVVYSPEHDGQVVKTDAVLPTSVQGNLVEKLALPASAEGASLYVEVEWYRGYKRIVADDKADLTFEGTCEKTEEPDATAKFDCDSVVITLSHPANSGIVGSVIFNVSSKTGFSASHTLEAGDPDVTVTVPKEEADGLRVTSPSTGLVREFEYKDPGNCGEPTGEYTVTCDDITFDLKNPKDGVEIELTFTPSTGDAVTRTVAPGASMEPVTFPGSEGLTVTISSEGQPDEVIKYDDEKPENCGGGGGSLPTTGPKDGLIAGGAGVLLALGAGLFLVARRRRIAFTA
jgi:LPXTG-motif cell wall-anchored protein